MQIPYVIDNQTHRLADVLSGLLAEHAGRSVDVATAYFTVQGFRLVKDGLDCKQALDAIRYLNQPLPGVQVKELRQALKSFQQDQGIGSLLETVLSLRMRYGTTSGVGGSEVGRTLRREDLHLVCFEYLCS